MRRWQEFEWREPDLAEHVRAAITRFAFAPSFIVSMAMRTVAYQVQEMVAKLKQYIRDDDLHHVRMLAQTLKGSGTSYGFVAITDVATQAIRALDGSGAISEALTELRRLEVTCGRLNAKAWSSK